MHYHLVISASRIREELGYVEPVSDEEALQQTVAWEQSMLPEITITDVEPLNYAAEDEAIIARSTTEAHPDL